jgi:hypothetical protein
MLSLLKKYHGDGKPFFAYLAAFFTCTWNAVKNVPPLGTENWKLLILSNQVRENHDLAMEGLT